MQLNGKHFIFLGDSITQGCGTTAIQYRFTDLLAERTGLIAHNYGLGGTGIVPCVKPSDNPQFDLDFIMRAKEIHDPADVFVIFGGINDFGRGHVPLGRIGDTVTDTFCGALHTLYTNIDEQYPNALKVAVTPIPFELQDTPNGICPHVLADYVDVILKTAERFGYPALDLFRQYPLDPRDPAIKRAYMPDGVHPNDKGHRLLADAFETFFSNL